DWCGVTMPPAYREYMLNIGSGMGPYYGLWRPARIRAEFEILLKEAEWGRKPSPSRPFPYSLADAQAIVARKVAGDKDPWAVSTWPVDGCIPICHQGCMYYSALVVAGECAGRVWDVAED